MRVRNIRRASEVLGARSASGAQFVQACNSNIGHSFLGMHGLNSNEHGAGELALNFVTRIRSTFNSGSAKQKLKEVHSKISSMRQFISYRRT